MFILGFLAHHATVLADLKIVKKKDINCFTWYAKERPVKLVLSLIFGIAGCVMLWEFNQLTATTAFFAGLSGDALVDRFGKITHKLT